MWVSNRPTARYIRKIGIVTTTGGSMRVLRMKNCQSAVARTRNRLKA